MLAQGFAEKGFAQVSWDMMQGEEPPQLWSAEEPNLYVLVLSLLDGEKKLLEAESCQVRHLCLLHNQHDF